MKGDFAPLSHVALRPDTSYRRPPEPPERVHLDSPALDVMTDFDYVRPRTTKPSVPIDVALEYMKTSGVRLLLVTDDLDHIAGIISSYDIQGERPIQLAQESRVPRSQITVAQIMIPRERVRALNLISVRNATVGHIVATLRDLEQRHVLVFESDDAALAGAAGDSRDSPVFAARAWSAPGTVPPPERSGVQAVRGLFSAAQIGRQLRVDVGQVMTPAHSLAEIRHELG